jgi:septin family protein
LIPVIAKADTLTDDEVIAFKKRVRSHVMKGVDFLGIE